MYAKYLSGSALATLIIVPIAGIAAYQVMQNNAGPAYIKLPAQIETPAEKKDAISKDNAPQTQLGGKAAATDEVKQVPLTEAAPAKPEPTRCRTSEIIRGFGSC